MRAASQAQRREIVQRVQVRFAVGLLLATLSVPVCVAAERGGELSGTVRDEHGVPQMGAVIELIGAGRDSVRTVVTGLDGHYVFADLLNGTYRLRASASFLLPVSTRSLHVAAGMQAVVNLTLVDMYRAATLLPAQRRTPDEASDDWMWTMRSAASRPVLRLAASTGSGRVEAGSASRGMTSTTGQASFGAGGFGAFGAEQAVAAGFQSADGARTLSGVARVGAATDSGVPLAVRVVERRQSSASSSTLTAVSYESDPAIRPTTGGPGWRSLRIVTAQTASFGDMAAIEVGSMLASDSTHSGMPVNRPFGRVRVFLPHEWTLSYALATDRALQRASDVVAGETPGYGTGRGVTRMEHGRHQAVALTRQSQTQRVVLGVYRDTLERTPVLGSGSAQTLTAVFNSLAAPSDVLVDGSDGAIRVEGPGLRSAGLHVLISQQVTPDASVELRFAHGAGLETSEAASTALAKMPLPQIRVGHGVSAGIAARGRIRRTDTMLRASYQWQPERMITPVDAFDAVDMPAYLGFTVEQAMPVWFAPHGLSVHASAANVLRQGLRKVVGRHETVATLAQELPTLQAGIGFTF